MAFSQPDFGVAPSGEVITNLPADGAERLTKRVTIAKVAGLYQLPSPLGQPIECWLYNRSGGLVTLLPGTRDRLDVAEIDEPIVLADGETVKCCLFETDMTPPPRVWWTVVVRLGSAAAAKAVHAAEKKVAAAARERARMDEAVAAVAKAAAAVRDNPQ